MRFARVPIAAIMVASLIGLSPMAGAQAPTAEVLTIEKIVVGNPSATDFAFSVAPSTQGCTTPPNVIIDGAGGFGAATVAPFTTGPIAFEASDFGITPTFSDVTTFDFIIAMTGVAPGVIYDDPAIDSTDYNVSGDLDETPSGFSSFNLMRSISGADFASQGSSISFSVDAAADLSDGLQVAELTGPDPVFVLNAREVDTGRYHPPLFELNADGTGRIQNSNNMGGINPATGQVVDADFGDEYISDLSFDPEVLTLADAVSCLYTVTELPVAGFTPVTATVENLAAPATAVFLNLEDATNPCPLDLVTIDMNSNGGNGVGTPGPDVILGTPGVDAINGRGGDDLICGGLGDDLIVGGSGNDVIHGQQGNDTIDGGFGDDKMFGQGGKDVLVGDDGDDVALGGGGNDVLIGNAGSDRLVGGSGADHLTGGPGQDRLVGGGGADQLRGQASRDVLLGQGGADLVIGGGGIDGHSGGSGIDRCIEGANQGLSETYTSCEVLS